MCEVYCIHFLYPDLYRSSGGTHPKPTHVQLGNVHKYISHVQFCTVHKYNTHVKCSKVPKYNTLYSSIKKNTIHMYSLIQYTVQTAGYYTTQIQYTFAIYY